MSRSFSCLAVAAFAAIPVLAATSLFACSSSSGPATNGGTLQKDGSAGSDTGLDGAEGDGSTPPQDATAADGTAPGDGASPGHDAASDASKAVDGGPSDASSVSDAQGGGGSDALPPPVDAGVPACDPTHVWGSDDSIDPAIPSAGFGQFGAVSRDELTVAYTTTTGGIEIADRTATNVDFDAPAAVNPGSTPVATDRVALAETGLEILAVFSDRTKIVGLSRPSRGAAWTNETGAAYVNVNALAGNGGGAFSEPVLGDDGRTLYFLFALPSQAPSMFESTWDGPLGTWTIPAAFTNTELTSTDATHRRRPTGGSSDGRTLFFYDEVAGLERGAWRASSTAAFTQFVDLGAFEEAAPNDRCDRLYFQAIDPEAGAEGIANAY